VVYRFGSARYDIEFRRGGRGGTVVSIDGQPVAGAGIDLVDDGGTHRVRVQIADAQPAASMPDR
jgi:hypothetical protein